MQLFEILFFVFLGGAILALLLRPVDLQAKLAVVGWVGIGLIVTGILLEGWRWQMFPGYAAFAALMLFSRMPLATSRVWRAVGAVPLTALLLGSVFLTHQLPIITLPKPEGPYAVGTFHYSITDESRVERYAPERNRELFVEVWYPANKDDTVNLDVRTLYQEMYEGDSSLRSFLASYLRHIPTHSHVDAPMAHPEDAGANPQAARFPVLLFSHGGMAFTSQNQQLMEHLASNGYVIFSIGHPYESMKVNLADAGTIRVTDRQPSDIPFQLKDVERSLVRKISEDAELDAQGISKTRSLLLALADAYMGAADEAAKSQVLEEAMANELRDYSHLMTETTLAEYLTFLYVYQHAMIDYRVEDMQFVAESIPETDAPISGFHAALDLSGYGVFGMSLGGAAAGEFCKADPRCIAGANLDGTQHGRHWATKLPTPFLMLYNESHEGGNDFAYLPPTNDFWDYTVKGTKHFDFIEVAHTAPILKLIGVTGTIDKERMIDLTNEVVLSFFDRYLKGKPVSGELFTDAPEIVVRKH